MKSEFFCQKMGADVVGYNMPMRYGGVYLLKNTNPIDIFSR
jgi:hypothetical protein